MERRRQCFRQGPEWRLWQMGVSWLIWFFLLVVAVMYFLAYSVVGINNYYHMNYYDGHDVIDLLLMARTECCTMYDSIQFVCIVPVLRCCVIRQ